MQTPACCGPYWPFIRDCTVV